MIKCTYTKFFQLEFVVTFVENWYQSWANATTAFATDTLLMPTNCRLWHFFTAKYCLRLHFHYKCWIVVLPRCRAAQLCKTSIYFGPWTGENSLWSKWTPAGCRSACQWYSTKIQAEQEYQNCYFIICKSFLFYILVNIKLTYMFLDVLFAKNIFIF